MRIDCFKSGCVILLAGALSTCGYHVAGRGTSLPAEWKTLAVTALVNKTTRAQIEVRMTEALVQELLARTTYRIVADESQADAVLRGEVTSIEANAVLFDTATGRATTMLVTAKLKISLVERATKKSFFQNDNYVFREQYEIATDPSAFFEEQQPALRRISRDFAARLVSAILENF